MGKDRREKDRESRGRLLDTKSSDDEKHKKGEKSKERGQEKERKRSREQRRERSKERNEKANQTRDRDREKRRKHSRERESKRHHPHESRRHNRRYHQGGGRSSSVSDDEHGKEKRIVDESIPTEGEPTGAKVSGDISLNIEETNKLRASLGLKPLQVNEQQGGSKAVPSMVTEEIHAPPSNLGTLQAAERLREKMETIREKRRQHKLLSSMKTLGEPDEDNSASSWVQKFDFIQQEKEKAEKRAQVLAEMDAEFGVGDLVQGTLKPSQQVYASHDLKGITVEHATEEFAEGKSVVLTLKDAGVLEETDDVLVNVNILEAEHAKRNIDFKRKRTDYDPYEEMDKETLQQSSVLKKYDEEIEGVKKAKFELGEFGDVDTSREKEAEIVKQKLLSQALTLEQAPAKVASEYFTKDEMVQFRKPKRKKKVRRLKADDLLGITAEIDPPDQRDHGARRKKIDDSEDNVLKLDEEDSDPLIGTALQRTRRLLKEGVVKSSGAAKVAQIVQRDDTKTTGGDSTGDTIVLDKTAEFCRQLGEEEGNEIVKEDRGDVEGMEVQEGDYQEALGGWTEVEMNAPREFQPKEEELYQEAEPNVSSGLSAALQMAGRKGFIDTSKQKKDSSSIVHVYSDVHRDRDYERQKERERERDLSHSRMLFPEKKSYNPHVNIEYVDDKGRELTPKEAFRYMSHKFHGRGSGKRKTEKRMKKLREEHFMNKASSVDTPLNTLAMLQSRQKKSQTPYILISGGSQSMLAPDLEKK